MRGSRLSGYGEIIASVERGERGKRGSERCAHAGINIPCNIIAKIDTILRSL